MNSHPVAICVPNYRMPERTDALVEHIEKTTDWPHEYFIVDMFDGATDDVRGSKYATMEVYKDIQMNAGLTLAVKQSKGWELVHQEKFLAYWFITTSMEFIPSDTTDIMSTLASKLLYDDKAAIVSPALDKTSGTAWTNMITRGGFEWRQTFGLDDLMTMYRADFFDNAGFTNELTMGWGTGMEKSWQARKQGGTVWLSEACKGHKERSVAYSIGRWHETPLERENAGRTQMDAVLGAKYGPDYIKKLMSEYVTKEMGTL